MSFGHQMLSATCFCRVFGVEFELEVKATVTVVAQLEKEPKNAKKTVFSWTLGFFEVKTFVQARSPYIHIYTGDLRQA